MDEGRRQDDLYIQWIQCGDFFRKCHKKFDGFLDVDNCEFIRSSQFEAGKLFLQTGKRIKYPFELPLGYLMPPEVSSGSGNKDFYAEYWLCVLDVFIQHCGQLLEYQCLPRYNLPYDYDNKVRWDLLATDENTKHEFDLEPPITDWVIKVSIKV